MEEGEEGREGGRKRGRRGEEGREEEKKVWLKVVFDLSTETSSRTEFFGHHTIQFIPSM